MKFAVSVRQVPAVLAQADELLVDYRDINCLYDKLHDYPDKKFILTVPSGCSETEWKKIKELYTIGPNLILALCNLQDYRLAQNFSIPFFWKYPISSFEELRAVMQLKPCYAKITDALFFALPEVQKFSSQIRVVANYSSEKLYPMDSDMPFIKSAFIRPEDVKTYEPYVAVLEFYSESLEHEAALLDIYKNRKTYRGNLRVLFGEACKDNIDNTCLPPSFGEDRLDCRHKCVLSNKCHLCDSYQLTANTLHTRKGEL